MKPEAIETLKGIFEAIAEVEDVEGENEGCDRELGRRSPKLPGGVGGCSTRACVPACVHFFA